jgi:TrmH family RNA methyltransferase
MIKIESPSNETFKTFLSLTTSKGLKKTGLFILSGEKLIREFLKSPNLKISYELITTGQEPLTSKMSEVKLTELSPDLFKQLDVVGTHYNLLVLEQPLIQPITLSAQPQGLELVLPIGDPGNLGALVRSCEAFGVAKIILTTEAAHPFLPKAVKASAGSVLRLPLFRSGSLTELSEDCIGLDTEGISVNEFRWPKNSRLVVGEEGPGLKVLKLKTKISIPTQSVESLNAVVATSIALFSYQSSRK